MNRTQTCPSCTSSPTRLAFATESGIRVLQCRGCGIQFAESYPDIEDADAAIYGDQYFALAIEKRQARERIFEEVLDEVESVLGRKGRLLDVGCGEGHLLEVATRTGWQAEGTEISSSMIRYAREERGLTVHHGTLENVALPEGVFDTIVLNHVLEHVKNPQTTLARVRELLVPDGIARVEVPNLGSLSARVQTLQSKLRVKKNLWRHYSLGHHFWFFTPRTLSKMIEAAGMSVITTKAPAVQWGEKSRHDRLLNALYAWTFWGGHLAAYARKRS